MNVFELLTVSLWPGLRARLLCVYDAPVAAVALRMRLDATEWAIWHVRHGQVCVRYEGAATPAEVVGKPGAWLILPPGVRSHRMHDGTHLQSFRFQLDQGEAFPWHLTAHAQAILPGGGSSVRLQETSTALFSVLASWLMPDPVRQGFVQAGMDASVEAMVQPALATRAAYMCWLDALLRPGGIAQCAWRMRTDEHPALTKAVSLLQDPDWRGGVNSLARAVGLSVSHLRRLFLARYGCPPQVWYDRYRLEQVKKTLKETNAPIKNIAFMFGFGSPSHFSDWFRRGAGISPGGYRRHAGDEPGV